MSNIIPVSQAVASKFVAQNPPKQINWNNSSYTRTYFSYDYGRPGCPSYGEALFELKVTTASVKLNEKNKPKLNAVIEDPEDLQGLSQLSTGFAMGVEKYKAKFGLRAFTVANPGEFRGTFFYPAKDGEVAEDAKPIVSLKLNDDSKFKLLNPKLDENDQPIMDAEGLPEFDIEIVDYKTIMGKRLTCSIVFNARDLYHSSGLPCPQMFVRSCMILKSPKGGDVDHAKSTIVRNYLMQNPEIVNGLADLIAKLKTGEASSDTLLETVIPPTSATVASLPATATPVTTTPVLSLPGLVTTPETTISLPGMLPMNTVSTVPSAAVDLTQFLMGTPVAGTM